MPELFASAPPAPLRRPIVFDCRDQSRTGLGRVAQETVAAWQQLFPNDPVTVLGEGGQRYSLRAQWEWRTLRRRHADAAWVWFHWDVPLVGRAARSVVYIHDLIVTDPSLTPFAKRAVARAWIGRATAMADRVVTVSRATANALSVHHAISAQVIPNGIAPAWRVPWTPQDYLLTVGEPRSYKNVQVAEQVAAALGVTHRHAWRVSEAELRALYAGARVVLVPSRAEGFGLPLLEAFSAGAPVVASDIPALREVSGGLALHVAPDDIAGWCDAVQRVWTEPGDATARRERAAQFTWERSATLLREVVRSLG